MDPNPQRSPLACILGVSHLGQKNEIPFIIATETSPNHDIEPERWNGASKKKKNKKLSSTSA